MQREEAIARLRALPAGLRRAVSADSTAAWALIGHAIPDAVSWNSVPPGDTVTIVWGRGGCVVRDAKGTSRLEAGKALLIDACHPHRGTGDRNTDFLTVFFYATDAGGSAEWTNVRIAPLSAALETSLLAFAAHAVEGDSKAARESLDRARAELDGYEKPAWKRDLPPNLVRARKLLGESFRRDIALEELAKAARLSEAQFSRRFAEVWGLPPVQYRKQLRLIVASRLLAQGYQVADAAFQSGFSDNAHLSRSFKALYGVSPSEWQREIRAG